MSHDKINKFENKERLEELSPIETLKRAGFKDGMVLCDIGAGTGVFQFQPPRLAVVISMLLKNQMIWLK